MKGNMMETVKQFWNWWVYKNPEWYDYVALITFMVCFCLTTLCIALLKPLILVLWLALIAIYACYKVYEEYSNSE